VPELRQRALRAVARDYAHVFAEPVMHRDVVNFLFTCYLTSPATELNLAVEFWRAYRHLVEGRSILDFPFAVIDREYVVSQLRKILRGDSISLEREEENHHARDHREEEQEDPGR
jgi:hypothetical protein